LRFPVVGGVGDTVGDGEGVIVGDGEGEGAGIIEPLDVIVFVVETAAWAKSFSKNMLEVRISNTKIIDTTIFRSNSFFISHQQELSCILRMKRNDINVVHTIFSKKNARSY
jgi:hypothetical protein